MSYNNSKHKKPNYSSPSYPNSQHKYPSNGSQYNYPPSYTSQNPPPQPQQSSSYYNKSSNNQYAPPSISELPNYSRPQRDPPTYSMPSYMQPPSSTSLNTVVLPPTSNNTPLVIEKRSNPRQTTIEEEPVHKSIPKSEHSNGNHKTSHSMQLEPSGQIQKNDTVKDSTPEKSKFTSKSTMIEESPQPIKEKEKVQDPRQNLNRKVNDKHKLNHEEQDLDVVQKKKKSESKYGDRLATLENELTKIKAKEVQVLKAIMVYQFPNVPTDPATQQCSTLLSQGKEQLKSVKVPNNYLIHKSLATISPDPLKSYVTEILTEKLKETAELQFEKQQLISSTRESDTYEPESNGNHIKDEGKELEPKKFFYLSQQAVRQADPKIRDLEERMEKLEYLLQERKIKTRETVKSGCESAFDLELAKAKNQILTQRLVNRRIEI